MSKYSIIYLSEANNDIEEIMFYLKKNDYLNGESIINDLFLGIRKLETFPLLGTLVPKEITRNLEFRKLIIRDYIVFYTILENIFIHRILHCKQYIIKILGLIK